MTSQAPRRTSRTGAPSAHSGAGPRATRSAGAAGRTGRPAGAAVPAPRQERPARQAGPRPQPARDAVPRPRGGAVPTRTPGRGHAHRAPAPRTPSRAVGPAVPSGPPRLPPARPGEPRRRQRVVLAATLLLLLVLAGRLVHVQALQGPGLAQTAYGERVRTVEVPADRGRVVDAHGEVLAYSVERWDVVANQLHVREALRTPERTAEAAGELARLLDVPASELAARLWGGDEPRPFVYLAKGLLPEEFREVRELGVAGVTGERTTERVYPAGTTGGNVLGFVGAEGTGLAGIEQVYEDVLAGTPGSETYEKGASGQRIPQGSHDSVPARPGDDVHLTLVRDVQYVAQSAIDAKVAETGAQWGVVQVLDVRTGEILALADSGTVDPNDPGATPAKDRLSRAVGAMYEPGSTAKVVTMAAALETGVATPTTPFVVPYQYTTPNGQTFKDSLPHPDQRLTLAGVLAQSSNTGTVQVGEKIPRQVRHDYLRAFGFGEPTGIGLPGEIGGILRDADEWDGRSQYAVLFGQAVGSTTLQNSQVFATIANGGVRVQPHVVAGTTDPDGTFTPVELDEPHRVVSEETAAAVMSMLESAVIEGTGKNAQVPGYRIAGKTGTAQSFEGGGVIKNVASFIGVAPADDPRIVVNVALYDPKTSIYGGTVAAPVFRDVTAFTLQHLGVPPSGTEPQLFPSTWE